MPIRITQTLPELKPLRLFKNTRGTLVTWTLSAADQERVNADLGPNVVLEALPETLYVKISGGHLEETLRPCDARHRHASAQACKNTGNLKHKDVATIARRGFPIASDFSGTAHSSICIDSSSLHLRPRCVGCKPLPGMRSWVATCAILRGKRSEDICITQPFSPNLLMHDGCIFFKVHEPQCTAALG